MSLPPSFRFCLSLFIWASFSNAAFSGLVGAAPEICWSKLSCMSWAALGAASISSCSKLYVWSALSRILSRSIISPSSGLGISESNLILPELGATGSSKSTMFSKTSSVAVGEVSVSVIVSSEIGSGTGSIFFWFSKFFAICSGVSPPSCSTSKSAFSSGVSSFVIRVL